MLASCVVAVGVALGAQGAISTVAGADGPSFGGDGGPALGAALNTPADVSATGDGGYLIADTHNDRIRSVAADGRISTVAGSGTRGFNGDGKPATSTHLDRPSAVAALPDGGFLIADAGNHRIRRVGADGDIATLAGNGSRGYNGDGGPAVGAMLDTPRGVAPLADGGFLIADTRNHLVRQVSPLGVISTVAGTPGDDSAEDEDAEEDRADADRIGDGGPAIDASLGLPDAVAVTAGGGFLIADRSAHVVRLVNALGTISTVAGQHSVQGDEGGGGPATAAELSHPTDVEPLLDGGFLVSLAGSHRIRRVRADGTIEAYSASGSAGFTGDGGPATEAQLDSPRGLAISTAGDLLIADSRNHRIRLVDDELVPAAPPLANEPGEATKGRSVVVGPASGRVRVRRPGRRRFALLGEEKRVPVGSLIDARRGSVLLESALTSSGKTQTGQFGGGVFQVRQARRGNGMTHIVLRGGDFSSCRRRGTHASAAVRASARRRAPRRLWGRDDRGRFRTHGRDSVATTRGTAWVTVDRCGGTLTRVTEGAVVVRDRRARKTVRVSAGHRYFARRFG